MTSISSLFEGFGFMKTFKTKFPKSAIKFKHINRMKRKYMKVKNFTKGVNTNV